MLLQGWGRVGIAELVTGMNFVDSALTGGNQLPKKLVFKRWMWHMWWVVVQGARGLGK